jgi:predicted metalloprotease with PDZ domain
MIHYRISCQNPASQFVQLELEISSPKKGEISLQLPAWRAGRYQLANYAQNIRNFRVENSEGKPLEFSKKTKDQWVFDAEKSEKYFIRYEYFAAKMDAGSAWVDDEQVYLNLVNCCFEVLELKNEAIELSLSLSEFPNLVSTLPQKSTETYLAEDFQQLADSTVLASKNITHWEYQVSNTVFHIWIQGQIHFDKAFFLGNFKKFTERQIQDFGEFPESAYHFIFQLLPYPHFHGVEHRKGTVIVFGPAENLKNTAAFHELLGVSSHELYHAWNVCRIRPLELLPYDFSQETYTQTGWILEGVTTYMGDLYLLKSGVYDLTTYLQEINDLLLRESIQEGWKNYSILESSHDLWLDGYQPGIPDRKVNIYSHGALICFCLDMLLHKGGSSLSEVMKMAWRKFGKPMKGYQEKEIWSLILNCTKDQESFEGFYVQYIAGKADLFVFLKNCLPIFGLELQRYAHPDSLTSELGIISQKGIVTKVHPESPAYTHVMIGDVIDAEIGQGSILLKIARSNGKNLQFEFNASGKTFYSQYKIIARVVTAFRKKWMN